MLQRPGPPRIVCILHYQTPPFSWAILYESALYVQQQRKSVCTCHSTNPCLLVPNHMPDVKAFNPSWLATHQDSLRLAMIACANSPLSSAISNSRHVLYTWALKLSIVSLINSAKLTVDPLHMNTSHCQKQLPCMQKGLQLC